MHSLPIAKHHAIKIPAASCGEYNPERFKRVRAINRNILRIYVWVAEESDYSVLAKSEVRIFSANFTFQIRNVRSSPSEECNTWANQVSGLIPCRCPIIIVIGEIPSDSAPRSLQHNKKFGTTSNAHSKRLWRCQRGLAKRLLLDN